DAAACAARIHVESFAALSGLRDRRRDPVRAVPLVRTRQGSAFQRRPPVSLGNARLKPRAPAETAHSFTERSASLQASGTGRSASLQASGTGRSASLRRAA